MSYYRRHDFAKEREIPLWPSGRVMEENEQITLEEYDESWRDFQGDCRSCTTTNPEDEGYFSWAGCDVRHPGSNLGNTVYEVQGYNPITKEVEDLGRICAECLCYCANADIPDFVRMPND